MQAKTERTAVLLVGGLIALLLCCMLVTVASALGVVWMAVRDGGGSVGTDTPPRLPTPLGDDGVPVALPAEAEVMRRALADTLVPIADPLALAVRLSGGQDPPEIIKESAEPLNVGTNLAFWASNVDTNENFRVNARLMYATEHVYFWVDRRVSVDMDEVRRLVDVFEQESYPATRSFFGSEWSPGVDGDPHLYILYARGLGNSVAGYFSSKDELSPLVHEFSNGHEMFYLNADNMALADPYARAVLTHEFQHMIHFYRDRNEESWVNEGFSEVAAFLGGNDMGGFDLAYASDPDITLTNWPTPADSAHYGQAFLFLVYFLERFGAEATQALVGDPANGLDSIDVVLADYGARDPETREVLTANDLFRDWGVAMLLQDPSAGRGQFALESYPDAPDIEVRERIADCPVEGRRGEVAQYGVDYIELDCRGDFTLRFQGAARVRVVPVSAYSGDYAFWSNRGDQSDMALTREFDLRSAVAPVSLEYRVWYDIEQDYDYAYLEVSQDGGETWTILRTPSGTADNPTGNSYGWAYNGLSGGGREPAWIHESVDLSRYAGSEILVRFEYITDDTYNGEGLLLDDVRIDAIGYHDDFEAGEGGWQAEGFVRLYNLLPQTYRVVLVERGPRTRVTEVPLDEAQAGVLPLRRGADGEPAVLMVIATTRHTWIRAPYEVTITP